MIFKYDEIGAFHGILINSVCVVFLWKRDGKGDVSEALKTKGLLEGTAWSLFTLEILIWMKYTSASTPPDGHTAVCKPYFRVIQRENAELFLGFA